MMRLFTGLGFLAVMGLGVPAALRDPDEVAAIVLALAVWLAAFTLAFVLWAMLGQVRPRRPALAGIAAAPAPAAFPPPIQPSRRPWAAATQTAERPRGAAVLIVRAVEHHENGEVTPLRAELIWDARQV